MYSTAADGNVTLQLKEPDDLDRGSLAAMLARLQDDATFSISYQDTDILSDGSIDVLLGTGNQNSDGKPFKECKICALGSYTGKESIKELVIRLGRRLGSVCNTEAGSEAVTATFDLFDSSSGPDLTLSPQTFTNSAEAFINDNSDSLGGVPQDQDAVSTTTDDKKIGSTTPDVVKLAVKRQRPKAASPNRQGPQKCQICAKTFGNASALAKHKLTHSDERKYVCTMCGKAFKRQDHLNGHMLTHRNKKPYECKAEGCGKSYCDARSLRRHTENHHSSSTLNTSTTTMSPAQGAASGDASSPHGSSCIQYAPPPSSTSTGGKSQLQQLLSTEPAKGSGPGNNDGLTKQQLDLIHQIMEQTQRQSQSASKPTAKPAPKPVNKTPTKVQRTWSSPIPQSCTIKVNSSPSTITTQSKVTTTTPCSSTSASSTKPEPKPVECNLCHRKFKNIPALNGHMRLHGGYFKKETDSKKNDKKDSSTPPLQTASVSVRALIEEKIINRRTTTTNSQQPNPKSSEETPKCSTAPPLFPLTVHSPTTSSDRGDSKITSFVVPAPPQQSTEKVRRHSDAESFASTRPTSTQQDADTLADLILKREKVAIKRTTSDPGQQQMIQFQSSDSFTLNGVTFQADDGGYLSPPLQDEVFTQVQDSMLLQGVDAQQLASIQFQADSLLQDQNDQQLHDIALDDYTSLQSESPSYQSNHSVNQDLQAVLDSPLPESLADFSTFHANGGLDIASPNYQTHSPAAYIQSPHSSLPSQSPLQSPPIPHDSPGFAYPTPPASHEAQSPCFGQNVQLPMVSPKQNDFAQVPERGADEPPQVSSPLTAAFFTSTMSSSAAVEEALEEVLPGESIAADDIYPLSDSPTPPSPVSVGLTPSQSPLSNLPSSSSSTPGSSSSNTFSTPQNFLNFSMSPQYTFQSQMLPNSEDPLLSSSPKDCVTRKKIELNGVPLRLISNHGLIDLNSGNFAGILVDANGEIKLIQTGNTPLQAKNFVIANTSIIQSSEVSSEEKNSPRLHKILKGVQCSTKQLITRPKQIVESKKEGNNDVFLSPTTLPSSPVKISRKRPRSDTLQLPILHQSKLRASRSKPQGFTTYTPQPILSPNRCGTGLYCNIKAKLEDECGNWASERVPETDSTPHINVGAQFQCRIPAFSDMPDRYYRERKHEDLLWDPGISRCTDNEVDMYLDFACCAAVPGGGRNKEYAMHLLNMCGGNIHEAMLKLMQPSPSLPSDHPLLCYQYSENDKWSSHETELFYKGLLKYDKDFRNIAQEIGTKTVKQCIQFYYIWKKVCTEEHRRIKQMRERKQTTRNIMMDLDFEDKVFPDAKLLGIVESGSPMPSQENRNFICEFSDCSASFNSRAALNGHIRIHGGTTRNSPTPSSLSTDKRTSIPSSLCHPDSTEDYPCKICGKTFTKIKSRSAHMKSHRPLDAEPTRKREKEIPSSTCATSYDNISVPSQYNT